MNKSTLPPYLPPWYKLLPAILIALILPLSLLVSRETQDTRQHAAENTSEQCTLKQWNGLPDWLPGSNALGNGTVTCIDGTTEFCKKTQWKTNGILSIGDPVGHAGTAPNFIFQYGAVLPVGYDGTKDTIRFDYNSTKAKESSWARVLRWTDEIMKANPTLNPDVVLKYEITRLKKEVITLGKNPSDAGFDLSNIDEQKYSDEQTTLQKVVDESKICPTEKVASTTLDITVLLGGIGNAGDFTNRTNSEKNNKSPLHSTRSLTLEVLSGKNNLATVSMSITYDKKSGTFTGNATLPPTLLSGQYALLLGINGYLTTRIDTVYLQAHTKNILDKKVAMISGDLDQNNLLNNSDYTILFACMKQMNTCIADQALAADLNDDGKVNQTDYNLFLRELPAKKGDE